MSTRRKFVREACKRSEEKIHSRRDQIDFDNVTDQLRSIARKLDPPSLYAKNDWPDRNCLCGRLAVLIADNPDASAEKLSEAQRNLAISVLLMDAEDVGAAWAEPIVEDIDPNEYQLGDLEQYADKRRWATIAQAAMLAAPTLASMAVDAPGVYSIALPLFAAIGTYFATKGLQWGGMSLRRVSSAVSEHVLSLKKSHYSGMRRALAEYTVTTLGGENTYDLRTRLVRYFTMDAQEIDNYIKRVGEVDGAKSLDQLLFRAIRDRVRTSPPNTSINKIVGIVLAEFTFGGSILQPFNDLNLHCAFIPCAGVAHVGYNYAKDHDEFVSLKKLFAENYFRPSKKISSLATLPHDIVHFWRAALSDALNPDAKNHVPDSTLFTIYYFVYRQVRKYNLISSMHCRSEKAQRGKMQRSARLSYRSLAADVAFECIFADYERRFNLGSTWTDWLKQKLNLAEFG